MGLWQTRDTCPRRERRMSCRKTVCGNMRNIWRHAGACQGPTGIHVQRFVRVLSGGTNAFAGVELRGRYTRTQARTRTWKSVDECAQVLWHSLFVASADTGGAALRGSLVGLGCVAWRWCCSPAVAQEECAGRRRCHGHNNREDGRARRHHGVS